MSFPALPTAHSAEPTCSGQYAALETPSIPDLAEHFGFSPEVLKRISERRPELFAKITQTRSNKWKGKFDANFWESNELYEAHYNNENKDRLSETSSAVTIFRGMVLNPRDYDPNFKRNYFGTGNGETWFSFDRSKAGEYSNPFGAADSIARAADAEIGVLIEFQMPAFLILDAMTSAASRGTNVALLRSHVKDESVFIKRVVVRSQSLDGSDIVEDEMTFDEFRKRYPPRK